MQGNNNLYFSFLKRARSSNTKSMIPAVKHEGGMRISNRNLENWVNRLMNCSDEQLPLLLIRGFIHWSRRHTGFTTLRWEIPLAEPMDTAMSTLVPADRHGRWSALRNFMHN